MSLLRNDSNCFQVHQRRQADLVSYKKDTWVMVNQLHAFYFCAWYLVKTGVQDEDGRFSGNLVQDATEIGAKGKGL